MKLSALIAGAALTMATGAANAATLTVSDTQTLSTTIDLFLEVDQFDPTLGTLTALNVSVTGTSTDSAESTISAECRNTFEGERCLDKDTSAVADASLDIVFPGDTIFASRGSEIGACTTDASAGLKTCTASAVAIVDRSFDQPVSPTFFSNYIGTGKVSFLFDIGSGDSLSGASVTVTYTYDEAAVIPLPASALLLLGGLGGLTALRRRRASSRQWAPHHR